MKYTRTSQTLMVNVEEGVVISENHFLFILFYELSPDLSTVGGEEILTSANVA